ncbi:Spy/CpxP family protein refolding chaperone [Curvibacter sp. APW13]|uniref:Spy/CpxP family protein refolding chaperone n=1 Tax=Curvibacter sp. APW13 TaxID=3077236 RepID=UPI0028E065E9|nr:Spy/CpxP family protein refolding chaperone [Curvibacter sp. APW13]MDT8992954.1 Spy/CpxP family protein refolding chaperone [Curvibacter sp. APW13]
MSHFFKRHLKRTLLGLFGVTLVVGSLSACGHRQHEYGAQLSAEEYAQKRDKVVDKVASRLDLNEDQKKRLAVLGDKLYEQRTALIGQTKDPRAEMKALVSGDKFDAARAQALINDKTAALNAKSPEVVAALADFYNSLNASQQQKVRDYLEGRGRWFHWG